MSDNTQEALLLLQRELALKEADVEALRRVVDQLQGRVMILSPELQASSQEYASLGVTEAIRRFMRAANGDLTTREIVDGLLDRGIRTRSKKLTASVYATLKNNSKEFERKDGKWGLKG